MPIGPPVPHKSHCFLENRLLRHLSTTHLVLVPGVSVRAAQRAPPGGAPAEGERAQEAPGRWLLVLGAREVALGAAGRPRRRRLVGRRTTQPLADAALEDADGADSAVDGGPGGRRRAGLVRAHWQHTARGQLSPVQTGSVSCVSGPFASTRAHLQPFRPVRMAPVDIKNEVRLNE